MVTRFPHDLETLGYSFVATLHTEVCTFICCLLKIRCPGHLQIEVSRSLKCLNESRVYDQYLLSDWFRHLASYYAVMR